MTVTVVPPAGVDTEVLIVSVDVWPEVIVAGSNDADVPTGRPDTVSATFCATPAVVVVVIVVVAGGPGPRSPPRALHSSQNRSRPV